MSLLSRGLNLNAEELLSSKEVITVFELKRILDSEKGAVTTA